MQASFGRGAVVRAAFLVTGSTYITYALGLAIGAVVARDLGPTLYGEYAFVVWLSGWLVQVINNGLNTSGIRFVSDSLGRSQPETARNIHGWLLQRQQICLAVVAVGFVAISAWLAPAGWEGQLALFIVAALVSFACRAVYLFNISIAKGYGAFHVEAYSNLLITVANLLGVVVLAALHATLAAYLVLFAATSAGLWLYAEVALRRAHVRPAFGGLDAALAPEVKRHLMWTILLITSGSIGAKSIDTFLLNGLIGPREVGFFTIAIALTRGGTDLLTVGLSTVLMPTMGRAFGEGGNPRVNMILSESLTLFLFFGLILAGAGALWSGAVVTLLYGEEYAPVVPVLQTMIIVGGLTLGEAAFGSLLSVTGQQSIWAKSAFLSLVLSVIFAFSLVPQFGLTGATISYASSRLAVFCVLAISVVHVQKIALPAAPLLRLVVCAALGLATALPALWFLPGIAGQIAAGMIYVAVFGLTTAPLRVWSRDHVNMVLAATNRFPSALGWSRPLLETWRDRHAN